MSADLQEQFCDTASNCVKGWEAQREDTGDVTRRFTLITIAASPQRLLALHRVLAHRERNVLLCLLLGLQRRLRDRIQAVSLPRQ